jgi:hypothetical protein
LEFRRALFERRKRSKSTNELLLAFLQSDTLVGDLVKIMSTREAQAQARTQGLSLARSLLSSLRGEESRAQVLTSTIRGMRRLTAPSAPCLGVVGSERVHVMAGLQGTSEGKRIGVMRAFSGLLAQAIAIMQHASMTLQPHDAQLCTLALQVCTEGSWMGRWSRVLRPSI